MFLVVTYGLTVFGIEKREEEEEEKRGSRASELCGANLPNFNTAFT